MRCLRWISNLNLRWISQFKKIETLKYQMQEYICWRIRMRQELLVAQVPPLTKCRHLDEWQCLSGLESVFIGVEFTLLQKCSENKPPIYKMSFFSSLVRCVIYSRAVNRQYKIPKKWSVNENVLNWRILWSFRNWLVKAA